MKKSLSMVVCSLILGCVAGCSSMSMTATGPKQASRGKNCTFQLLSLPPASGFTEIGIIDYTRYSNVSGIYTNAGDFKEAIGPYVCEAGGDAAVASANGLGQYDKAVILKSTTTAATSAQEPNKAPPTAN